MHAVSFDEQTVDAIFSAVDQCRLPGAAVGIAIHRKPVYRKGFGLAALELPVLLSPSIRMRIGSTSKHFVALAYLLLCEEGRAGIDDPIAKHLPELSAVAPAVTTRHLMANTSGLRDACDIKFHFSGIDTLPVTCNDLLGFYEGLMDSNALPGQAWIYNNGGWVLLSVAIERISNRPLEEVLRERIFAPIGMHDTLLRRWDSDFVPNSAMTHMSSRTGGMVRGDYGLDLAGAGAIASPVDDMLRWLAHMDRPVVGSSRTWQTMRTSQRLLNGAATGYGLGLFLGSYRGVQTLHHPGGWTGNNSQMLKVPAAGLDVVIMVNREDVSAVSLAQSILDACLPQLEPIKAPLSGPFATGVFRSPASGRVVQLFAEGGKQFAAIDGTSLPVRPDEEGVLWPAESSEGFKQGLRLAGDRVQLNDHGNLDELVRVEVPCQPGFRGIQGRYWSDSTRTDACVVDTAEGLRLRTAGRFGSAEYRLECLATGIWHAKALGVRARYGGILSFDPDGQAFAFSTFLTRALPFRRIA
jgi:D-aminopeptidase